MAVTNMGSLHEILEMVKIEYTDFVVFLGPLWTAFLIGIVIGWAWKPKWATFGQGKLGSSVSKVLDSSMPTSPARSVMSPPLKGFSSAPCLFQGYEAWFINHAVQKRLSPSPIEFDDHSTCTSQMNEKKSNVVAQEDVENLCRLVDMKDGGPAWIHMMDRSTPTMAYQAWRRDPKIGPPQYRNRTVYEDATPELVRDFFWDDEFRLRWDNMLSDATTLDECPTTGTMVVQWIKKFPFFCKDREYIIGRRIWESGRKYYCVTKGVPYPSIQRHDKPRRVDHYYSSWCIQAVESRHGNGQLTACEVQLFHQEETGIPWEIAKLAVRKGLWDTVKNIESGLRAYQKERALGGIISRPAFLAQINTKINLEYLKASAGTEDSSQTAVVTTSDKPFSGNIRNLIIVGGSILLACTLDRGFLVKTVIFGVADVARKFANVGKKSKPK
ncbi:putative START-like domain-containing protein [Rosa chinensis]|uniref:Putative START-like domain-containing protein n=1 Tax=Rosa chinensis TaxID=74649 RepID=A0A2P6SPG1_ROSCH|nr:uncharacterized protein LOC112184521 [Rosa chinensis]PRQ60577.1 putative START-like domain-containing protein [Rosa chinensis]